MLRRFIAAATVAITIFSVITAAFVSRWFFFSLRSFFLPSLCPLEIRWGATRSMFFTFNSLTLENSPEIVGIVCNILLALFQSTTTMGGKKAHSENIMNQAISFLRVLFRFYSHHDEAYCEWLICNTIYLTLYRMLFSLKLKTIFSRKLYLYFILIVMNVVVVFSVWCIQIQIKLIKQHIQEIGTFFARIHYLRLHLISDMLRIHWPH